MDEFNSGPSASKKTRYHKNEEMNEILESDDCFSDEDLNYSDFESDSDYDDPIHAVEAVYLDDEKPVIADIKPDDVWEDIPTSMQFFPFAKQEGLLIPVPGNDPIDYLRHLMTDDFIKLIIEETNRYAVEIFLSQSTRENSRITSWKDITQVEFLTFIGLVLHMGIIKINRVQDYWRQGELFGLRVFSKNMSRNRFLLIQRCLNFSNDNKSNGRLDKISPIVNLFNTRMEKVFSSGRELILDEAMVLWRGRLVNRKFIQNKEDKYGIKLYMLTNPTGIILKFILHTETFNFVNGKILILELLDGKLNVGHSLYMNKSYNSYELAKLLLDNGTHCTGIININQKGIPIEVKEADLKQNETIAKYANGIMIAKWRDKREICYISSEYDNEVVEINSKPKPRSIVEYNNCMSNTERPDQFLAYYASERKTVRWSTRIFVHVLEMMVINAYYLYNKYSGNSMSLYDFRISLITKLLNVSTTRRVNMAQKSEHVLSMRAKSAKGNRMPRKHCRTCYQNGRRKDTAYVCTQCPNEPGFCLECAFITHK